MKKRSKSNGDETSFSNEIKISEMKGKYLFITGDKKDYIHDPNIFCIDTTSWGQTNAKIDGKHKPSGVVVLCMCVLNYQKNNVGWAWGKLQYDFVSQSKNN